MAVYVKPTAFHGAYDGLNSLKAFRVIQPFVIQNFSDFFQKLQYRRIYRLSKGFPVHTIHRSPPNCQSGQGF